MPTVPTLLFKLHLKLAFVYEMVYCRTSAYDHYKQAETTIKALLPALNKMFDVWEIKAIADTIMRKQAAFHIFSKDIKPLLNLFFSHFTFNKQSSADLAANPKRIYMVRFETTSSRSTSGGLSSSTSKPCGSMDSTTRPSPHKRKT